MPPKANAPNKKTQEKQKAKIVEDKTFGMKNKKGAKQQKFIQQVQKQVQNTGQAQRRDVLDPAAEREKRKEEERKKKEELASLFKPVVAAQTVAKGVDPKSVVCVFFKQGLCQKGERCKFSHDLTKERKAEKRSVYEDVRSEDTMDKWDEQKLEDVVNQKHGEDNKQKNTTQIVCKYFIEAVENSTYGWFWVCPNEKDSGKCMYRHALPPGFTLKSDRKKQDEQEEVSLETLIETERSALGPSVTRVTLESFLAWKKRKVEEKKNKALEKDEKKKRDFKLGFMNGLTGRDLFTFNPELIALDDDDANNDIDYKQRADDDDDDETDGEKKQVHELNLDYLASQAREVDGTGTVATSDRFDYIKTILHKQKKNEDEGKLDMACGGGNEEDLKVKDVENGESDGDENDDENEDEEEDEQENEDKNKNNEVNENKNTNKNIEIDESLFTLEDLGNIQDELENLDI